MKNKFSYKVVITSLLLILIACDPVPKTIATCVLPGTIQKQENSDQSMEAPKECVIPKRALGANMQVNAQLKDFNPEQEDKMRQAIERIEIIINSEKFKKRVLEHEYNGERIFADNDGLSNEEVYQKIMEGAETLLPYIDEEMDVDLTLYYTNNSTVGYTYPNTTRIWINNKFFSTFTLGKVAANVTHEWTHKIGFGHDFKKTPKRPFSVPYGVGRIIQELVDQM